MLYRVSYHSMTASYGPQFIRADSPEEAKQEFGGNAFTAREKAVCCTATEASDEEE